MVSTYSPIEEAGASRRMKHDKVRAVQFIVYNLRPEEIPDHALLIESMQSLIKDWDPNLAITVVAE
jgi:hypothetical protein